MAAGLKIQPWKELQRKIYVHSPFKKIVDILFELPDGRAEDYALTYVGKVVCVFALTAQNEVVLTRQFRPGPNRVLDELPGGGAEDSESMEEAALRELVEETGYVPEKIIPLGEFCESAYSTIERHAFLAIGCKKMHQQKLDQNEFIEVVLKSIPEFVVQLRSGQCTDGEVGWAALYEAGFVRL